ncbi:MAG: hypothetical protein WCF84_09320 [Anaerolineae bacterium]
MPCNLAARVNARISNAALAKTLTPQIIEQAMRAFAKAQNLTGEITVNSQTPFQMWIGANLQVKVFVDVQGFTVEVTGYRLSRPESQKIVAQITQFLTTISGALVQQQVVNVLRSKFAVEEVQKAANGAVVVTMEM